MPLRGQLVQSATISVGGCERLRFDALLQLCPGTCAGPARLLLLWLEASYPAA